MRALFWNIRAGGGKRAAWIARQIARWNPDLVGLCEFRATAASQALAADLSALGWSYQLQNTVRGNDAANAVFVCARTPVRRIGLRSDRPDPSRWLLVRPDVGPDFGILHAPNHVTKRKQAYFERVTAFAKKWRGGPTIIGGDTNCGIPPIDGNPATFHRYETNWIPGLEKAGWRDAFRVFEPDITAYSWYSPNAGNGYRLDQAFANRSLQPRLQKVWYEWGAHQDAGSRRDAISDHAALLVDFDWP